MGGAPVLFVEGDGIAEVWEKSLVLLWEKGTQIRTEYDKSTDPPAKDAAMVMVIRQPFAEPRIHLGFCGGIEDLEKYRQEVVDGVHDHWIAPEEGKWTYTYHQRLTDYLVTDDLSCRDPKKLPFKSVNQLDYIVRKLSERPYSRRAQGITWMPLSDPETDDPPCLQRVWCRLFSEEDGYNLQMHTHWRSRDAYRAAYMNIYGLTDLQKVLAAQIQERLKQPVSVGSYVDITDSYHIYGSSFEDFQKRFLKLYRDRVFFSPESGKGRTLRSDDSAVIAGIEYGKKLLEAEKG
ncbi:MAG: thymidylate synthase [Candidatus Omnitrophota bacterium]|nr:hypothetical protein [Candidatus Omnitrophota bacterium]